MAATGQLQALLDSFEARLSTVEKSVLSGGAPAAAVAAVPMASSSRGLPGGAGGGEVSPAVAAFDAYCQASLDPFMAACDTLGGGAAAGVSSFVVVMVVEVVDCCCSEYSPRLVAHCAASLR